MTKKIVRLTEGDLHRIIKEAVNGIINEEKEFRTAVLNANAELQRALSFVTKNMMDSYQVKKITKLAQTLNEVCYYLQ